MSKTPTITMDAEIVRQLAFDVANDFFTDEELCVRYDLTLGQLKYVSNQPSFAKAVLDTRQLLADDGKQLLLQAKEYVMDVLDMYKQIADDSDNTAATRMKAGDAIMELARVKVQPNNIVPLGGGGAFGLVINTNLMLDQGSVEGAYLAKASKAPEKKPEKAIEADFVEIEQPKTLTPDEAAAEFL